MPIFSVKSIKKQQKTNLKSQFVRLFFAIPTGIEPATVSFNISTPACKSARYFSDALDVYASF
jgi:hypothetical protein